MSQFPGVFHAEVVAAPVHVADETVAVALNVAGDPASAPLVAVAVCAPIPAPSVHVEVASPVAFVTLDTGASDPPLGGAQFTVTPDTGVAKASVTSTASGVASAGLV